MKIIFLFQINRKLETKFIFYKKAPTTTPASTVQPSCSAFDILSSIYVSSVESNLINNPVLINLNDEGESLPVGTVITIDLVKVYLYKIIEIDFGVLNDNNLGSVQIEFLNIQGENVVYSGKIIYYNTGNTKNIEIVDQIFSTILVNQIKITLLSFTDNNKVSVITMKIKGCYETSMIFERKIINYK